MLCLGQRRPAGDPFGSRCLGGPSAWPVATSHVCLSHTRPRAGAKEFVLEELSPAAHLVASSQKCFSHF